MKKLVDKNTKSPNISFGTINVINESFRWHINRWTDIYIFEIFFCELSESEISYFGDTVVKEDICNFDISVYDMILRQIFESFENIKNIRFGCTFTKKMFPPEFAFEIPSVTDLRNNITVSIAGENFVASEDVGMTELFEYIDFWKQELFEFLRFEGIQFDHLDGHSLI